MTSSLKYLLQNIKAISAFLRRSRKRNNASNREEWLLSMAEKRQRLNELGISEYTPRAEEETNAMEIDGSKEPDIPSCARTDAKPLNRDTQMKYDIAKNEDGPLRRTMKGSGLQNDDTDFNKGNQSISGVNAERHPGLAERLENIETHLAIRYGTYEH